MKKVARWMLLWLVLSSSWTAKAAYDPDKVCRIENGKIIFTLNLKWSEKEKKEISGLFDLDSALIARAFSGETKISFEGENWNVSRLKNSVVELSKPFLSAENKTISRSDDLFFLVGKWMNFTGEAAPESVVIGVNDFKIANTFLYEGSNAWFYLSGYTNAAKVYISGTFNQWSTSQAPMKAGGSGWSADLKLKPGKYLYKFIADGKWIQDPYNNLKEKDGSGGYNSVVFCPNHTFRLKGYPSAHRVVVTGNFCRWNPRGLEMKKNPDGWSLPVYLRDGTYAYKFIVDNQWMTDPANPDARKDPDGNLNSFLSVGEPYLFSLNGFKEAGKVVLTGSFNGWNTRELLMSRTDKGWQIPYVVPAGNYEYKFIADGKWMTDPANPFSTGSGNYENSFIALKANHLFTLSNHANAQGVLVTGSFNSWNTKGYRMKKEGDQWIFPMFLKPGKYTYKFIVDGKWIIDPANKLFEQNEYNTYNSVLWINN